MAPNIYFVGMSKNCFSKLEINLNYLIKFKSNTNFEIKICIVDSDSIDGTKEFCKNLLKQKKINKFIEIDNLEKIYNSRIERLSISRNLGVEYLKEQEEDKLIYIPIDMDLDLFQFTTFDKLNDLISLFIEDSEVDAMFPYSIPYYYDIFALRCKGWVDGNNLLISRMLKDKVRLFTFIFNYIYIFRKQRHINMWSQKQINVISAFGGMGMYKVENSDFDNISYDINQNNVNFYSEHLFFNEHFQNLSINLDWNISSPTEYTFFKSYNLFEKIIYILKTIKNDFKNIISFKS